jgi:N-methylhydantoinase B
MNAGFTVVSGNDYRRSGAPYLNQFHLGFEWRASECKGGWLGVTYGIPVVGGLMYRDSVEVDELKRPILFKSLRLLSGSGGAGKFRGAPVADVAMVLALSR